MLAAVEGRTDVTLPAKDVLELLTWLLAKSFVVVSQLASASGYHQLEPIRQYLVATDEADEMRNRHAAWFLQLAGHLPQAAG